MTRWFASKLWMLALLLASAAAAEPRCGQTSRPWVSLTFSEHAWPAGFERAVLQDFQAGLAAHSIDVCQGSPGSQRAAVAVVQVSARGGTSVGVSVDLRDSVTEKRVGRDIDLSLVPADGRAFAVAIAVDELLRASWAELALERPTQPTVARPREVDQVVEQVLPERARKRASRVGARGATERFFGGQTHLGADASFRGPLSQALRLELTVGGREALTVQTPGGRVSATAFGAETSVQWLFWQTPDFELGPGLGARILRTEFRGIPEPGSIGANWSGAAIYARANAAMAARLFRPIWLELGAGVGAPLRALEARDAERSITGTSGLELSFHAGLSVEL